METQIKALLARIKLDLNDDWRKLHTFVSTWLFVFVGASGDIYNELSSSGILDQTDKVQQNFLFLLHAVSIFGVLTHIVKGKFNEVQAEVVQAATQDEHAVMHTLDPDGTHQDTTSSPGQ